MGFGPADPLPIHFLTIVLDGEPFIRYHLDLFKKLPFHWHWHIVEGVADLVHDTDWSLKFGGQVPPEYKSCRSIDGTSDYLDKIAAENPDRINVYRKPIGVRWDGKVEMVRAPMANITGSGDCLLWQIDADEFWTAEQLTKGRQLFLDNPQKTAAHYWCWNFVGPELVISTRNCFGNVSRMEWLRTWRFRPGMTWLAHEPPILCEPFGDKLLRNVGLADPFTHDQTEAAGLIFQHLSYVTPSQIAFKEKYYGYAGAMAGWHALQKETNFPRSAGQIFPWVKDGTLVDRAENFLDELLFDTRPGAESFFNRRRLAEPDALDG